MKKLKMILILILVFSGTYLLIDDGYFNLDHLNKGKLMSILITVNGCHNDDCSAGNYPMTITDQKSLKEIEASLFMKPATNFIAYTKEQMRFNVIFSYAKGSVELNVGYYQDKGKIKYSAKQHDYALNKQDIEVLSKYLFEKEN